MRRKGARIGWILSLVMIVWASGTSIVFSQSPDGWKEAALDRMARIEVEAASIRLKFASDPGLQELPAALAALEAEWEGLSASMGGDRPAALGPPEALPHAVLSVPLLPPSTCLATTATFGGGAPVAIPTGPAVVTSTLIVAGAGDFLWDLNLTTNITHTFAADLDITLQSPAGTVVTLTTDNGAGNDNVFNGTVWDDSANPGGQVPYTANNGLATDHAYVNLTLASPLVPEESLGAFFGENPNGTWTLTISDDLSGDGGNVADWSLELTTLTGPPIETAHSFTQASPTVIPTGPAVVTSTLDVAGAGDSLSGLTLTTFLEHTFAADLDITLQSPAGTVVTLSTDNGAGNDNVFNGTLWDDSADADGQVPYTTNNGMVTDQVYVNLTLATPLVPEEALGAFLGEDPNGTWTLTVSDDLTGDGGTLANWTLNVLTATCIPTLLIDPAPPLPFLQRGTPWSVTFTASGGTGPYSFSLTGTVPPGLIWDQVAATLSGTPTWAGTYDFTIEVMDANEYTGSQAYTVESEPLYTLNFYDNLMRGQLCVDGVTGHYVWTNFMPWYGTYEGQGVSANGGTAFWTLPEDPTYIYATYDSRRKRARAYLTNQTDGVYSAIVDSNTTNNPPCGEDTPRD